MALVLKKLYTGYFWVTDELADPRLKDYPLVTSPFAPLTIIAIYLYLVYRAIPKFMENRKPYKMKTILILYNISQIVLNASLVYRGAKLILKMNTTCNLVDYTYSDENFHIIGIVYSFYLLKMYDLLDTIFIVLKKNTKQASFLHVYHHAGMAAVCYIAVKYVAGGELIFTGVLNVIVHTVMYSYYLLAAIDSEWKKNLTVKKLLTQLQLAQFALNVLIFGRLLFKQSCPYPKIVSYFYVGQNLFMSILFLDFYINAYIRKSKKAQ